MRRKGHDVLGEQPMHPSRESVICSQNAGIRAGRAERTRLQAVRVFAGRRPVRAFVLAEVGAKLQMA
eukprot:scaffold293227_cov39-Tisochrysis_lutea.AAC.2